MDDSCKWVLLSILEELLRNGLLLDYISRAEVLLSPLLRGGSLGYIDT